MQAIVCEDEIGWRKQARRILVFATDAGSHVAGDGKLAGIETPNDGQCHMEDHQYTHSTVQDYPSVSQINDKVKENSIKIIFAVAKSQQEFYRNISRYIEGSSVGLLRDDSSILELVRKEYNVSVNLCVTYYTGIPNLKF